MSQSFEQHFAQQPEEEKSPEQIKEEKGLELAREIKKIKKRMEKEGKTIEGYQRIIELVQEIEEMYKEKREFISEEAKEIYQSLKKTLLWDEETQQWNWRMDREGGLEDSRRYSWAQLLGVLAEAVVGDFEEAKKIYQSLKKTPLWDKEKKQWNWYMNKEGELKDSDRVSWAQLVGVLAEAVVGDFEEAKEIYQSLKETLLWDKETQQWNRYMNKEGELIDSDRYSGDQLLGVLAEAVVGDFEEAKKIYQSLKETPLWDKEKKQWNGYMNKEGELKYSDRVSWAQLVGVLAEAVAGNLEEAKEIYQSLKETPLWDKEKKQWNVYMNKEGELIDSNRYSGDQLLGVLAEAVDEKGEEFVEFLTKGNK